MIQEAEESLLSLMEMVKRNGSFFDESKIPTKMNGADDTATVATVYRHII